MTVYLESLYWLFIDWVPEDVSELWTTGAISNRKMDDQMTIILAINAMVNFCNKFQILQMIFLKYLHLV